MTTFTRGWSATYEATPANTEDASLGAQRIRYTREDIRERIDVDHFLPGNDSDRTAEGEHRQVSFYGPLGADPTNAANKGFLYMKDVSSKVELFWEDEDGNVVQLTSAGSIQISAGSVDTAELADNAVTAGKIAAGAVDTSELATDAVTAAKIAAGAVDTSELATDAVTAAKIAAGAVDSSELASGAVTADKLAAGAVDQAAVGANSIGQSEIKTASDQDTGSLSTGQNADIAFTGGFYTLGWAFASGTPTNFGIYPYGNTTYTAGIRLRGSGASTTYYFQADYIQASPPYDLGDGEIPLFIFGIVTSGGDMRRIRVAPDPPWAYHGPTKITGKRGKDGKIYQEVRQIIAEHGSVKEARQAGLSAKEIARRLAEDPLVRREVTQSIKNADLGVVPHPFIGSDMDPGDTIVMLDPVGQTMHRMLSLHDARDSEETVAKLIRDGDLQFGNTGLPRNGPPGVLVVNANIR